jgi:hypothetical protein
MCTVNGRFRRAAQLALATSVLAFVACTGGASPARTPSAIAAPTSTDVVFTAGADQVHGTLLLPIASARQVPAAVIIAGSGPTDRDGNSALEPGKIDTLKDFANVLASSGVASLRYDKLGTGATGLASYASHPDDIGFDVFVNEATAAYNYLRGRPEVDPQRIMILGHSEGALIAMVMTDSLAGSEAPRALVLAAPPGNAYLETIEQQLRVQYAAAVHTGHANQQQADAALADVGRIVMSLKTQGTYPPGMTIAEPALQSIFSGANQRFLAEVERYDPATLAAKLPAQLPILVLHGGKDQQISDADIARLAGALGQSSHANVRVEALPDADHVFKDVPGTPDATTDYTNPRLSFSSDAAQKLQSFAKSVLIGHSAQ